MGLAYLTSYFASLTETFIYREVMELQRRGFTIRVYSLRRPERDKLSREAIDLYDRAGFLLPVKIFRVATAHVGRVLRNPGTYFLTLWKMLSPTHSGIRQRIRSFLHFAEGVILAQWMERDGITHIHAHYASQATSVARVVHLLTGIPYSFTGHAHDIWHDRLLLPEKISEASFVICCSRLGRACLLDEALAGEGEKIHVVYHGLNPDEFAPEATKKGREINLILSIGRLTEQKGFSDLLAACALLRQRGIEFRCLIIGEGELRQSLTATIERLGLGGHVELVGAVPQEVIRDYYRKAWMFVLPCVDTADGNRDGIPNVLLEAMSMGVPVVTTTNAGQIELIEHGRHGLLVPPCSPERLADAMALLCQNWELWAALGRASRARVIADFDSRRTIEPLADLFERHVPDCRSPGWKVREGGSDGVDGQGALSPLSADG